MFRFLSVHFFCFVLTLRVLICRCLFKSSAAKGGCNKGKELVIDVDNPSPRTKRTRFSTEVYDPDLFRSYAAFQTYTSQFQDATLLVEKAVDQHSLLDMNIPIWFATKDWNFLLSNLEDAYENLVKEFYANAVVEGEEIKC